MSFRFGLAMVASLTVWSCSGGADSLLTRAAEAGDESRLVQLLAEGADPDQLDGKGWSALIWAVDRGHHRLVSTLVDRGADPNLRDTGGRTALLHAISQREMDAARALLNSGADPNLADGDGVTPLILASGYGYHRVVRVLLERGADPRLTTNDGETALERAVTGVAELDHITIAACQTETVEALLDANPGLQLPEDSWARRVAGWKRCGEILAGLDS